MKKNILLFAFLTLLARVYAYDFSAVCESGQILYYRILSNGEVAVCPPSPWGWNTAPEGALVIPESVESQGVVYLVTGIDNETFSYCHGITSVVVPNSVTSIGNAAFSNIISLSEFFLPNSVSNMGDYVFASTNNIMHEVYNDKIFAYHPRYDQSSYTIPEGIEEIASGAFYDCPLQMVNIPNSVNRIGKGAFSYSDLKSVIIPEGVTCIEENVFSSARIHSITLPNSVTSIEKEAFYGCSELDTVVLPNTLQSIGRWAFRSCGRLRSVVIPNSVTSIGEGAFSNCSSMTSVVFPDSVDDLGAYVFKNCHSLTEPVYNCHFFAFYPCDYASFYHIPEGVETILEGVFWECNSLDSVAIPNSVKTIETQAFEKCVGLTYVSLPESLETIEDMAFRGCSRLSVINLPNSLNYLGNQVFCDCQNLREPLFNNRYFAHFPKNYATTYSIPEGIQEVLDGSFVDCDSLLSVSFPSSVTRIRDYAVSNCPNLLAINIFSDVPPVIDFAFYPWLIKPVGAYIYVPVGSLETYLNDDDWVEYSWCLAEMGNVFSGREWYYEIQNDDGSVTYQHLAFAAEDTIIDDKHVQIVVRTNHIYDDKRCWETTHEYIYTENNVVYWWNKELKEFTRLYDFGAEEGDSWEIKVGSQRLVMHVDLTDNYEYKGNVYHRLQVSDEAGLFSGDIVCGIGHLSSFFPERLMSTNKAYEIDGLRCHWVVNVLLYHQGNEDCTAVYNQWHHGSNEDMAPVFMVYPNPTDGIITIKTLSQGASQEYRITNMLGQTIMSGVIKDQSLDVSALPSGIYFLFINGQTVKLMKQ